MVTDLHEFEGQWEHYQCSTTITMKAMKNLGVTGVTVS